MKTFYDDVLLRILNTFKIFFYLSLYKATDNVVTVVTDNT